MPVKVGMCRIPEAFMPAFTMHMRLGSQMAGSRVGAPGLVDVGRPFWCSRQCRVTVPARASPI